MALPCLDTISMASWSSLTFLISEKSPLRASLAVIDMAVSPLMMVQDSVPLNASPASVGAVLLLARSLSRPVLASAQPTGSRPAQRPNRRLHQRQGLRVTG